MLLRLLHHLHGGCSLSTPPRSASSISFFSCFSASLWNSVPLLQLTLQSPNRGASGRISPLHPQRTGSSAGLLTAWLRRLVVAGLLDGAAIMAILLGLDAADLAGLALDAAYSNFFGAARLLNPLRSCWSSSWTSSWTSSLDSITAGSAGSSGFSGASGGGGVGGVAAGCGGVAGELKLRRYCILFWGCANVLCNPKNNFFALLKLLCYHVSQPSEEGGIFPSRLGLGGFSRPLALFRPL